MTRTALLFLLLILCGLPYAQGSKVKPISAKPVLSKPTELELKLSIEGRGEVVIRLLAQEAPKTVQHIVQLVKSGFYTDLRFHRVDKIPKPYLVQVGDPQSKSGNLDDPAMGTQGSGMTVPFEDSGRANVGGAVGLAHLVRDSDSGDSQFYILLGPSKFLDGHYTVFGEVVSGMAVVDHIQKGDRITSASIETVSGR